MSIGAYRATAAAHPIIMNNTAAHTDFFHGRRMTINRINTGIMTIAVTLDVTDSANKRPAAAAYQRLPVRHHRHADAIAATTKRTMNGSRRVILSRRTLP